MVIRRNSGHELTPEELAQDLERDTPFRRFRQRFQNRRTPAETPEEPALCEHLLAEPARNVGTPSTCDDHTDDDGPVVHLRTCLSCGYVGCCDSSRGRHATAHAEKEGHPVMQSAEPGETWRWCYPHELLG